MYDMDMLPGLIAVGILIAVVSFLVAWAVL